MRYTEGRHQNAEESIRRITERVEAVEERVLRLTLGRNLSEDVSMDYQGTQVRVLICIFN